MFLVDVVDSPILQMYLFGSIQYLKGAHFDSTDILKNPECLNHLKKQRNKIKSCCNPAKTNRCRAPANLTETLQRDWLKAYESACEEGIFRNEKVPDSYQTSNQESTSRFHSDAQICSESKIMLNIS